MTTRVSAPRVARLIPNWSRGRAPLHLQLVNSIRELIATNVFQSGDALPSERSLAVSLSVSRTTVASAYQVLRGEGWLQSFRGSGNYVWRPLAISTGIIAGERLRTFLETSHREIDLSSGALPGLPLVVDEAMTLTRSEVAHLVSGQGYLPRGLPVLLAEVARYYGALGLPTSDEQILVTDGSQDALRLLASVLFQKGDRVVIEDPTFRGAIDAFEAHGVEVVPVERDLEGIELNALSAALREHRPRAIYLLPNAHNPTGQNMSISRRRQFAALIAESDVLIIDDGSTMEPQFDGTEPRPLALDMPEASVVSVGSLSKLFWGGLRVGWIRAPKEDITVFTQARSAADLGGSLMSQLIASKLIPQVEVARRLRCLELTTSLTMLCSLLSESLPRWSWPEPSGGTALWVDTGQDSLALSNALVTRGIAINSGPMFSSQDRFRTHIRIPLAIEPILMEEVVRRIASEAR